MKENDLKLESVRLFDEVTKHLDRVRQHKNCDVNALYIAQKNIGTGFMWLINHGVGQRDSGAKTKT